MAKATHTGTCQICGNMQKLPNGRLSKHGYTVDYGYFNGVCRGHGALPFERSIDLIAKVMTDATAEADRLEAESAEYASSYSHEDIMHRVYRKGTASTVGGYIWIKDALVMGTPRFEGDEFTYVTWENTEFNRPGNVSYAGSHARSVAEAVPFERAKWAKHLMNQSQGLREYVKWQQKRIKNWEPTALTPID